ncbi:MAG: O-antigen ligase family protein [Candidatus Marinimicrobia bacterium]|nr:O-antigen ligase family protein [Candidatus Neomarinimicrobiota bacterium]
MIRLSRSIRRQAVFVGLQGGAIISTAIHPLMPLIMAGGAAGVLLLFYYSPILLILLANVGLVKGALLVQFPIFAAVDLTLLLSLMMILVLAIRFADPIVRRQFYSVRFIVMAFIAWVFWMLLSAAYAPRLDWALEKGFRFALVAPLLFLGPLALIRTRSDSRMMLHIFLGVGALGMLAIGSRLVGLSGSAGGVQGIERLTILAANPIAAGRVFSICASMTAIVMISGGGKLRYWALPLGLFLVAALFTGSRGPVLSFILATALMGSLASRTTRRRTLYWGLLITTLVMLVMVFSPEALTSRFQFYLQGGEIAQTRQGLVLLNTVVQRIYLWEKALTLWTQNIQHLLVGVGTAGYIAAFTWRDVEYPHNLPLEILTEHGLLGLSVFGFHFLLIAKHVYRKSRLRMKREESMWLVGALTMFLATLVSGDLNDNRMLWFFLAGLLATVNVESQTRIGDEHV